MFGPCVVLWCFVPFACFAVNTLGEERAARLPYFYCLLGLGYCYCSLPLPHGAEGWSLECHCDISWSYLHAF